MGVVPSGQVTLHEGTDRLGLTVAGEASKQHRFAFDRRLGTFERDGRTVCALGQIGGVDVEATAVEPGLPFTFMLVITHRGGGEHLYVSENKQVVAELAARLARFLGVRVTDREQPAQRQIHEATGDAPPSADHPWGSPLLLPKPIAVALSAWQALVRGMVGLGLFVMGGLALQTGSAQGGAAIIGGVLGLTGLYLLVGAVLQVMRSAKPGTPGLDPVGASASAGAARSARSAPAGASPGSMGLIELVGRTKLMIALVAAVVAGGIMLLMITTEVQDNAAVGFLVGLGFAGVSAFVAWRAIRDVRIWRAIQASPVSVEAVVQEIRSVSSKPPRYALEYRYHDSAGRQHVGRSFPLTPAEAGLWRPFDVAAIIFNRHRPEQSMLADLHPLRRPTHGERHSAAPSGWTGADRQDI